MVTKPPMRIAHIVYSFGYGGLERRILRLVDGLSPLGARFTIVSLRDSAGNFLDNHPQVEHIVMRARPGVNWAAIRRLARILRERDINIVHSHNWVSMLEGVVAGRLAKVPVVVHGEHGASRFEPDQLRWRRTLTQALLARMTDAIIPVNESIRDRIVELWHLPPARCTVIRNGVDTERFRPVQREPGRPFVVGSLSRLEHIKNFPCLIRAVHALNTRDPGAYRLVIVGEGSERPALEHLVGELGAGDYVELPGATNTPEDWYQHFDAYVNCSFSEGMSNTVLEAMACGLPVVATDCAGHRDWLTEGENALFFVNDNPDSLAQCIGQLQSKSALAETIGRANRAHVEAGFSQARFIDAYASLYSGLLPEDGPARE